MATCPTCKGQYDAAVCLCPRCKRPLRRGVTVCHICRAQVKDVRLCPRCQSDVTAWEQEDLSLPYFLVYHGGIMGLFPAVVVWLVWFLFFLPKGWTLYDVVVATISSSLSLMAFLVIYEMRLEWREAGWLAQISKLPPPQLVPFQIFGALIGILLAALSAVLYALWIRPWAPLQKLAFALVYVLAYVMLTVVITLVVINNYMEDLNRRVPQPVFMDTRRLLRVLIDAVREINLLGRQQQQQNRSYVATLRVEEEPFYEVVEAERVLEDGGIRVLVHEWLRDVRGQPQDAMSDYVEMYWRVRSDRWGRISSMRPESLASYQRGGRMVRMLGKQR